MTVPVSPAIPSDAASHPGPVCTCGSCSAEEALWYSGAWAILGGPSIAIGDIAGPVRSTVANRSQVLLICSDDCGWHP